LSFAVLFALVHESVRAQADVILEGNFRAGQHETTLRELQSARTAQVLCRIDEDERRTRIIARAQDASRHPGHGDVFAVPDSSNDTFLDLPGERLLYVSGSGGGTDEEALLEHLDHWWR
jgi:hypothetical protein